MDKYGVAFYSNWCDTSILSAYPQVTTCSSKESAIKTAECLNSNFVNAVAFENVEERTEVNWGYILKHKIK